ncbi:hypothetical protein AC1031_005316 [Aphanomyces cochlioides]|nr:hypothetical protein AC1031_005316 [Aphanomyces cochlioides]
MTIQRWFQSRHRRGSLCSTRRAGRGRCYSQWTHRSFPPSFPLLSTGFSKQTTALAEVQWMWRFHPTACSTTSSHRHISSSLGRSSLHSWWPCSFFGSRSVSHFIYNRQPKLCSSGRFDRKLMPPPQFSSTCFALQSILGDLSLGEWCLVIVYMTGLIVVISAVPYDTDDTAVSIPRLVSVFCGHMSMIHLAFLIVPVSQLGWWLNLAQSRLIKFHKGLSILFLATTVIHLAFSIKANRPSRVFWHPELITSQNVRPLYGSLAFICFLIMSITATAMVRRHYYEIFLIIHRVMFVLGVVFVCMHNHVVRLSLICPLAVYGLCGLIVRVPPFLTKYQMDVDVTGSHTVLLTLPLTPQTHKWVTGYRLCSHIYLNVPAISSFEWHPFALVVTPHHDAIAVCIKITKPFSFTHKLHRLCQTTPSLTVKLAGPYGQPTVDFRQYQQVVLVGGGIGITPLLGAINHLDKHSRVKLHLAWVVRHADELLCCQAIMFPLPPFVTCEFYVSLAVSRGVVMTESGDAVSYFPGRFVIDDVLRRFQNIPDTCVLACGPQAMVVATQREAYDRGFDFQKVVYAF